MPVVIECETCYGIGDVVDYTAYGDHRLHRCPTCYGTGDMTRAYCGCCEGEYPPHQVEAGICLDCSGDHLGVRCAGATS